MHLACREATRPTRTVLNRHMHYKMQALLVMGSIDLGDAVILVSVFAAVDDLSKRPLKTCADSSSGSCCSSKDPRHSTRHPFPDKASP